MDIKEVIKELDLEFYGYNEDEKALVTWTDCQGTFSEFNKITEKLDELKISYEVVNYSYIEIKS